MPLSESEQFNLLDQLAEEFAERFRRGERPAVEEYTARYPELADDIRELFPAMVKVEQVDEGQVDREGEAAARSAARSVQQIGDYRILGQIGRGGMGVVYEAEQISLGRRVALKVLPRHVAADRTTLERFRREARAAARLHHTNIVPVYEVGQDGDVRFYAMQFILGQSLDGVIAELRHLRIRSQSRTSGGEERGTEMRTITASVAHSILAGGFLPERDVRASSAILTEATEAAPARDPGSGESHGGGCGRDGRWHVARVCSGLVLDSDPTHPGRAAGWNATLGRGDEPPRIPSERGPHRQTGASALVHAHARGVIHRDIKPSNLLLDTDGVVWVTDFGLAKADDDGLTQTGDVLGTIRYMAPERFSGAADPRSDVYALGLTLYELLVLRPAFDSPNRLALIEQVRSIDPPRPRLIDPRIPLDLETIVLKAIEKDPKARYGSADAMSEDLRRFLADEPIEARQVSAAERYWRWAKRNPTIASLGGVVTALLLAVTVGSMVAAAYFKASAQRETSLAVREQFANQQSQRDRKDAVEARRLAILERDNSRQLSANLALEKGLAMAEEGRADRGLLWMFEAFTTAPDEAKEFRKVVRWNLGAWLAQIHKPLRFMTADARCDYIAFSPDGKSFATGFSPGDLTNATPVELWDTDSGVKLRSLPGAFAAFAFAREGKVLVARSDDRHVVAVDVGTGGILWKSRAMPGAFSPRSSLSDDGATVLCESNDKSMNWWLFRLDAKTGEQIGEALRGRRSVTMSPDGRMAAAGREENGEDYIDVRELPTGRLAASWRLERQRTYQLTFSPDARFLFSVVLEGDGFKGNVRFGQIWDAATGKPTSPLMAETIGGAYSPAGDRILTCGDSQSSLREAASGRARGAAFPARQSVAMHPDGRLALVAGAENTFGLWQIRADAQPIDNRAASSQDLNPLVIPDRQTRGLNLFWSGLRADGQVVVSLTRDSAEREHVRLSDSATGRPLGRPAAHQPRWVVRVVGLSPDGRILVTGSNPHSIPTGELRFWDATTGKLLFPPIPMTNYVSAIAFHPGGKVVATGDYNGLVRMWDMTSGNEIGRPLAQGEIVLSLAYSPDGSMIAAGLAFEHARIPGTRLWNTTTRQPIGERLASADRITRLEFRPDGHAFLAASELSSLRLWSVTAGQAVGPPMIDEASAGFSPDGRVFLTLGREGTVKIRDAATAEVITRLISSRSPATCAAFRRDGSLIAAGFADGGIRLCDPVTSQQVGPPLFMRHGVHRIGFSSDGQTVVVVDDFGEARTWPVPEPIRDQNPAELTVRIEARTGLHMQTGLTVSQLGAAAWRERLEQLGRLDSAAVRADDNPLWHEPMVREAEQLGNNFAAIWHLDRLIVIRPDDWFLLRGGPGHGHPLGSSTRPPPIMSGRCGWRRATRFSTSRPNA